MRVLSKLLTFFCGPVFLCSTALGSDPPPPLSDPLRQIVESELAFAHKCSEIGISKSFTQFFAGDCVVFVKGPANGKRFYAKYKDAGRKLIWQPVFAAVAASGEMGVTTGPWQMSKSTDQPTPIAFGQFVSVWKKQPDHSWKVILDLGVDNPQPTEEPGEIQFLQPDSNKPEAAAARRSLAEAEKTWSDMSRESASSAITALASDDVRILRDGAFPAIGKDAAKLMLSPESGKATRTILGGKVAASADLAYRYGQSVNEHGNNKVSGNFLCVWRLEAGQWKIVLDVQKPSTPAKK